MATQDHPIPVIPADSDSPFDQARAYAVDAKECLDMLLRLMDSLGPNDIPLCGDDFARMLEPVTTRLGYSIEWFRLAYKERTHREHPTTA